MLQLISRSQHRQLIFTRSVASSMRQYSSTHSNLKLRMMADEKPNEPSHNENKKNRLNSMQVDATPLPKVDKPSPLQYDH